MEKKLVVVMLYGNVEGVFENESLANEYCKNYSIEKQAQFFFTELTKDKKTNKFLEVCKPLLISEHEANLIHAKNSLHGVQEFKKAVISETNKLDFHINNLEKACKEMEKRRFKRKKKEAKKK